MERYAVFTGNNAVWGDMIPAAKSVLANSKVDKIFLLVDTDKFPYEIPKCVEVVDIRDQKFFDLEGPNMKSPYTYLAMMRAALALMPEFKDADRILSLDCDVIALRDINGIWDLPIEDYYYSASRERHRTHNGFLYCNTGVALYNLKKLRDGKAQEVIDVLNRRAYTWLEQDVFNYLCQGRIHDMPSEYNVNDYTKPVITPYIRHFAGLPFDKWRWRPEVQEYKRKSWSEVLHGRS